METFELRYFLAAAEFESVTQASAKLAISPPAVSRAISRLEEELGVQLFEREGRNISLTSHGKRLQREASRIIENIDEVKTSFKPSDFHQTVSISGTEFGLSAFLSGIVEKLKGPAASILVEVRVGSTSREVERMVADGESQIGITDRVPSEQFKGIRLGKIHSQVFVGEKHPLFASAMSKKEVRIEKLIEYEFAGFTEPLVFGIDGGTSAADGWRDDKLPRKFGLKAASIDVVLRAAEAGLYICYVPEAVAAGRNLRSLKVGGCPYKCDTEIFLVSRKKAEFRWMALLHKQ